MWASRCSITPRDEWQRNWWATFSNRPATPDKSEVIIHTLDGFGDTTGRPAGAQVVVKGGQAAWVSGGSRPESPPTGSWSS